MNERFLTMEMLEAFKNYLIEEEKSASTIEKYTRDAQRFFTFAGDRAVTKDLVRNYKQELIEGEHFKNRSINSILISLNSLLDFLGWNDCRVKTLKIQQEAFTSEDKELTKEEFERLVATAYASGKEKIALIIQTICGTGIRVSELSFITVEAARIGEATVRCKGKIRKIFKQRKIHN